MCARRAASSRVAALHALMSVSAASGARSAERSSSFPCTTVDQCTAATLWHIPGPNPIVSPWNPDGKAAWMSTECEVAGGVQKVNDTYVFVYHCLGTSGYRVGMSTAKTPMGPWTKPPVEPNLDVTAGAWDKDVVASFNILPDPENAGHWLGYFEGGMPPSGKEDWSWALHAHHPHSDRGPKIQKTQFWTEILPAIPTASLLGNAVGSMLPL